MASATTINQQRPASYGPECAAWLTGLRGDYSQDGIGVGDLMTQLAKGVH